jgi:SnoaL-like domain
MVIKDGLHHVHPSMRFVAMPTPTASEGTNAVSDIPRPSSDDISDPAQRIAQLETRIARLEDERELRDLLARYSFNADLARHQEYVDLYTPDGAIDLRDDGKPRYEGSAQLLRFISTDGMTYAISGIHHAAPTVFRINGDDAIGEGYSILVNRNDDGSITIVHANFSHWTFRRVGGEWKIVERVIRLLGSKEAPRMITETTR